MAPDQSTTSTPLVADELRPRGPYDGLNRAQRRKAMASEARAFRKEQKRNQRDG